MPKEKNDPSVTSQAWGKMITQWHKIGTVLSGTESMRDAGERYLPRHENEKTRNYDDRLERTVLDNASLRTLDSWVGRPFSDPIKQNEDIPTPVSELLDNVDLQGNRIDVFARNWFKEGLSKAFAHVIVDFPIKREDTETPRTLLDDRLENARPYWSLVKPENLIFATATIIDGQEILTHVRIKETETLRDGWKEIDVERIRIFDRIFGEGDVSDGVFFSTWKRIVVKQKEEWVEEIPKTRIDFPMIPLVTFYADRCSLMVGKSPIEDLVDLNIRLWQSSSDQTNIMTVSRFPLLALSGGRDEDAEVVIGPKRILHTPDPQGRFYYVEHTGAAIEAGRQNILDIKEAMAEYGADFLRKRSGDVTATAKSLDSAEATSPLQDATIRFNDALNQVLHLTGLWLGIEDSGTVEISKDFGPEEVSSGDLDALKTARQSRDISRQVYLDELSRRGVLSDEFDPEVNDQQLEEETMDVTGDATEGDIDELVEE